LVHPARQEGLEGQRRHQHRAQGNAPAPCCRPQFSPSRLSAHTAGFFVNVAGLAPARQGRVPPHQRLAGCCCALLRACERRGVRRAGVAVVRSGVLVAGGFQPCVCVVQHSCMCVHVYVRTVASHDAHQAHAG
jgi:hypothetical protein